jgi:uncharacterized protein involved in type VI secretion and phage assembly
MTDTGSSRLASRPAIEVGGSPLAPRVAAALRTAAVDTDSGGPDSCRLVFDDPSRDLLRGSALELAATLTLDAGRVGDDTGERIFTGVVYALGFDFDDRGTFTTVTAYDRSYALHSGLHTVSYQNVTDADLARQIAREVGLQDGTIDATPVLHDHVSQINETHFDFLARRAREVGCQLLVTGEKLHFRSATPSGNAPDPGDFGSRDRLQLVPGANLQRLAVRISGAQQAKEVETRGWDPATKQALAATVPAATRRAEFTDTPASVADRFGGARHTTTAVPMDQQAECDALASAVAEDLGATCAHAEGVAYGDPRLLAGTAVSLGSSGGRFDGRVTLTRARHVWDDDGYRTSFVASGSNDRSLMGLLDRDRQARGRRTVPGLVIGIVTNVADPEQLCRVRVRFPWLADDYETNWVRVLQVGAGGDRGLQVLPEVEDEVLVGFDHGDSRQPYVLGGLYNGMDAPPRPVAVNSGAGTVDLRVWRSRSGHEVVLDDTSGKECLTIRAGGDVVSIALDAARSGLTIKAGGDVTVEAQGKASVTAGGDLTLEASGNASLKAGGSLTLQASSDLVVTGATIKLN